MSPPTDDLNDLDVNTAVWGTLMNVTFQAVHRGRNFMENLRFTKNQLLKSAKQLFQVTEKLIEDQKESMTGPRLITKSSRGDRRVYSVTKRLRSRMPKTHVFADSLLCLGSISDQPVEAWKNEIQLYLATRYLKRCESNGWRAKGVRVEDLLRIQYIGNSRRDSKDDGGIKV